MPRTRGATATTWGSAKWPASPRSVFTSASTSESTKARKGVVTCRRPVLRAAAGPAFCSCADKPGSVSLSHVGDPGGPNRSVVHDEAVDRGTQPGEQAFELSTRSLIGITTVISCARTPFPCRKGEARLPSSNRSASLLEASSMTLTRPPWTSAAPCFVSLATRMGDPPMSTLPSATTRTSSLICTSKPSGRPART